MSKVKTFVVSAYEQFSVTLEVDLGVLTEEAAHRINAYWGGGADRLDAEGFDIVRAVVRLLGCRLIAVVLEKGGLSFDEQTNPRQQGRRLVREMLEAEGLGDLSRKAEGIGVRLVRAYVEPPGFEEVKLNLQALAL